MRRNLFSMLSAILILTAFFGFRTTDPTTSLEVGEAAPLTDLELTNVNKAVLTLDKAKKENGLLVIFSCNTCPFVLAWEHRYNEIAKVCAENKVGMVVINPNEARREGSESIENMGNHAKDQSYDFPYLVDANHKLADAFGAMKTPDVFLFNGKLNLAYKGAIDNSGGMGEVTEDYLLDAIARTAAGKPADPSSTKAIGCSIKRL